MIARLFNSSYMTYVVVAVFIAIAISFGLQALGVDAKVAQIISWVWLLLAYFVRHRQSSVDRHDAG